MNEAGDAGAAAAGVVRHAPWLRGMLSNLEPEA